MAASTAPESDARFVVTNEGLARDCNLSADAAGIVATLYALSHLSFRLQSDHIGEAYHLLSEFAFQHEERKEILAAID